MCLRSGTLQGTTKHCTLWKIPRDDMAAAARYSIHQITRSVEKGENPKICILMPTCIAIASILNISIKSRGNA